MIKVENVDVWGIENAIRAIRNPMNSWALSDSVINHNYKEEFEDDVVTIGVDDLALMRKLYKAGNEHRTYARVIQVAMDIVAPLYWWKEMDRYTVGKSQISCSTMHKIHSKEFTFDDFSTEHMLILSKDALTATIQAMNIYRKDYLDTKDKQYWWQLIQLLPTSYNQRRTVCMSYEVAFKIIKERTGHRLDEWNEFVDILKELPYIEDIIKED